MSSISVDGSATYISIQEDGGNIQYQVGTDGWNDYSWPLTITNTNDSAILQVLFVSDITLTSSSHYVITGSNSIRFGSTSLKDDGTRPTIYINSVSNYSGLIANSGFNDIAIVNLDISANSSTFATGAGVLCRAHFASGAANNFVVNCSVAGGTLSANSGAIVGQYAASDGGSLSIIGCSSIIGIGTSGGGIAGAHAADTNGTLTVQQCYSVGNVGTNGGGIIGGLAATGTGSVIVSKCFSMGVMSTNAGGIFGYGAGSSGAVSATDCYSRGSIGTNAGGVFGGSAEAATATISCPKIFYYFKANLNYRNDHQLGNSLQRL